MPRVSKLKICLLPRVVKFDKRECLDESNKKQKCSKKCADSG